MALAQRGFCIVTLSNSTIVVLHK